MILHQIQALVDVSELCRYSFTSTFYNTSHLVAVWRQARNPGRQLQGRAARAPNKSIWRQSKLTPLQRHEKLIVF